MTRWTSSKPHHWISPRPYTDASLRRHAYGPIQPMEPEGRDLGPLGGGLLLMALFGVVTLVVVALG